MPSYFFHIVFDLDTAPVTSDQPTWLKKSVNRERDTIADPAILKTATNLQKTPGNSSSEDPTSLPSHDWRYDKISVQDVTMQPTPPDKGGGPDAVATSEGTGQITNGISAGPGGLATKGKYEPLGPKQEELGWGVVRLYKDSEETPGLYEEPEHQKPSRHGRQALRKSVDAEAPFRDENCTTLCILAVPSYLTPSDFLGFVGEKTRDDVSHFRMIRTERGNRYMVLMKFRNGKKAREWRKVWNGKPFDGMEVGQRSIFLEYLS